MKSVRFPYGFAGNLRKNANNPDGKIHGLKSHGCHIIMQRLLASGVRPFLNKEIRETIIELCSFFQLMCARKLNVAAMENAQNNIILILCKLENIFPPVFFDIMVHLTMHLPEEALLCGSVHTRWMYPFELYLGTLKKYVRNRARPEGSIAEGYIVNEALTFCSMYLKGVETLFNRPERNMGVEDMSNHKDLSIFQHNCRLVGAAVPISIDENIRKKAERYILNNCEEIDRYRQ